FGSYSREYFPPAAELVRYLADYARDNRLQIDFDARVESIARSAGDFVVRIVGGRRYRARCVVIATGVSKPVVPAIAGIEHAECYTKVSVDPVDFEGQRVLVLGKGNSAFETADNLIPVTRTLHMASPHPLQLAWQTHHVGHLRAVNNNFLDTYHLKSQNALINAEVRRIERRGDGLHVTYAYRHADGEVETLVYDRVIYCTGFRFDSSLFADDCRPQLVIDDRFPAQTSAYESVNVPGLFFAGVLNQARDYKKKQSGFIHGFRYNAEFLGRYLAQRYAGQPLEAESLGARAEDISAWIIARVNSCSALWQQTGYFCDAIVAEDGGWRGVRRLPIDFVRDTVARDGECFMVSLEFGQRYFDEARNVFAIPRPHKADASRAAESPGLHPVVRHYRHGALVSEHHLLEDFENVWREDVHRRPLQTYLQASLESGEQDIGDAQLSRVPDGVVVH
ncbi:MAG: NAD(P)-binding domain-containing protein, partial [Myxococcales bacterium]|nr:NAD(P)-binding domain-containing protein [Myxococcales bacterium]